MKFRPSVLCLLTGVLSVLLLSCSSFADCSAPQNKIVEENCLPGAPASDWDISGAGDPSIQGFATDISVNAGQRIDFKIKTDPAVNAYRIDIYRLGYYQGLGARLKVSLTPDAGLTHGQPSCLLDAITGLVDCGSWNVSASWQVPADAISGIYLAHLVRNDGGGESHIVFIVRDDASFSDLLFQASDTTWQAYNGYGGRSLYGPDEVFDISSRAYKVSYNRPFDTRAFGQEAATWLFGAEYPMVRWLEQNGYDVTYFTGVDAARNGNLITRHKIYLSVGHDEYWSGEQRASVEAARDAGVNLAFFSGNEVYWKTRWEPDASGTAFRTLVCYKETLDGRKIDPQPTIWTGTWRDARFSPPADGGRPENELTGTSFQVNGVGDDNPGTLSIKVPADDGKMRFWRNTSFANLTPGSVGMLPKQTLGYEWDVDADNVARPAGLIDLSTTTYQLSSDLLLDEGETFGAGTATHHLTLYRAHSGALVFGAGTIQWSWGLDDHHDDPFGTQQPPNKDMQQATANLFADMGVQPATVQPDGTLESGLVAPRASTDIVPPASKITWPTNGTTLTSGVPVIISGTAQDVGGGVVGGMELSVDGGSTWHPATGRENWSYLWTPRTLGSFTLKSRATDDSVRTETTSPSVTIVSVAPSDCPCSNFSSASVPSLSDANDANSVEVGVRFRADFPGYVTGLRFYKASANTGTHIGNLWSNTGTLLARATFTNETASGWQEVSFSQPVAVDANTTYVASYFAPNGHYAANPAAFANTSIDTPPLHFLMSGFDGLNGIFTYASSTSFPVSSFNATNYWVDVVYIPSGSMPGAPPAILLNPSRLSFLEFTGGANPAAPQTVNIYNEGDGTLEWTASSSASWLSATPNSGSTPSSVSVSVDASALAAGTYTGTVTITAPGSTNPPQAISVVVTVTNLLLFSDFADGTMQGWAFSPLGLNTNWSVANGALNYNGGGHTQVYAGDGNWSDYAVAAAIKLNTPHDFPGGLRGHVDPITGEAYTAWFYPDEGLIKLFHSYAWNIDAAPGPSLLGQAGVVFDTTNFHNLQLSFKGNQIQVLYDGNAVINATDAARSSGLIALDVSTQVISFHNVIVTSAVPNPDSLSSDSDAMNFTAAPNSNPQPQTLKLTSTGGALAWTATSDAAWLTVSPAYGATPANLEISVASSILAPGSYSGNIKVVSLGVRKTTQMIPVSLTVGKSSQSITITSAIPTTQTFNTSFSVSATGGGSGNPINFALDASSTACSIGSVVNANATLTAPITMTSGTGNCIIDVNQAGNATYGAAAQVQVSVAAAKANPAALTVTGPAVLTYGTTGTAAASGGSGTGSITFSTERSSGCSVNGTRVAVTDASGTCSLTAVAAADNNYSQATSAALTVALNKANALITVVPYSVNYDGQAHTATGSATGVEGTPADLSSLLTLSGTMHTNAGAYKGDVWSFAGNNNYKATNGTVDDSIALANSSVAVTFQPGPYQYRGSAFTATAQVNGTNISLPVSYSGDCINVTAANGCVAAATFAGDSNHAGSTGTSSITITRADATITVSGYTGAYDGSAHGATGSATGVQKEDLGTLLNLGATFTNVPGGTVHWTFAGNNNYNSAAGDASIVITQANSTITLAFEGGPYAYRGTAFTATAQVNGGTPVPVVYRGDCTNVTTVNGCTATATYAGDANHSSSSNSSSITITQAGSVVAISCSAGAPYTYTGSPQTPCIAAATGVGNLSVPLTPIYSNNVSAGTATATATYIGDANHIGSTGIGTFVITKAFPTLTWPAPADITSGTALTSTQLNASATLPAAATSVPGTYTYTPPPGTVMNTLGPNQLQVSFSPSDTTNYSGPIQAAVTINVDVVTASGSVTPGTGVPGADTLKTGDSTSSAVPLQTSVTSPVSGSVSIGETSITQAAPAGYALFGLQANIAAPQASVASPLTLVFTLDPSLITPGQNEITTQVFKNAVLVPDCTLLNPIVLNPCVSKRVRLVNGGVQITVLTSDASLWTTGKSTNNTAPQAVAQSYATDAGVVLNISAPGLLTNAADIDHNTLYAKGPSTSVSGGVVTVNSDGSFTYTPPAGYAGTDSFTYYANDGQLDSAPALATIKVRALTTTSALTSSLNPSTFGQSVTFSAKVSSSAGTPTGIMQFYDGSTLLGTSSVIGGSASYTTNAMNAGSRLIAAQFIDSSNNYAASTSPVFTETVNKGSAAATFTFTPTSLQYSDPVTFTATLTPVNGASPATSAQFKVGSQIMGTQNFVYNSSTGLYEAILKVPLLETSSAGQLIPGTKLVTASFASTNFTISNRTGSLGITAEDARTSYAGQTSVLTNPGASTATIPLQWSIKDITAVGASDPAYDPYAGDITLARVTFVNRATGAAIATVPVTATTPDKTVGTATFNWAVDIGTATSQTYTVGVIVSGYYTRNSATENATITVKKQ